jgi:hypothetical protein
MSAPRAVRGAVTFRLRGASWRASLDGTAQSSPLSESSIAMVALRHSDDAHHSHRHEHSVVATGHAGYQIHRDHR